MLLSLYRRLVVCLATLQAATFARAATLTVSQEPGNVTSTTMWGLMFEDINHSGDGGIHGQVLRNNGFQGDNPGLTACSPINGAVLSVDETVPLSEALPSSLKVGVSPGATGQVGFVNDGYWGIPVDGSLYRLNVYIRGTYDGPMTWTLQSKSSGEVFSNCTFDVRLVESDGFWDFMTIAPSTFTSAIDVEFRFTFDAEKAVGGSMWIGLPRLYPTTWHSRFNGLKPFVAEALNNIGGSFLRFPGGNNLEGPNVQNRWKWNETIGDLVDRPGHQGAWGYPNTDALGLHEFFEWCFDMRLEPFLDIYSGYSLDGTGITGPALEPFIQEALDELEYVLGDVSTPMGALRAQNGYPDPWPVKWVEIGNEDDFGCATYPERFQRFYDAIRPRYPDLVLMSSATGFGCLPDPLPEDIWVDYHEYNIPDNYVDNFDQWDNVPRRNKYIIGEMARWDTRWSDMRGSVSEAVFMLGLERNSDLIQGVAFAPLLSLVDNQQWTPNLIPFHQAPDALVFTSSYWVQQLFAHNAGDMTKAIISTDPLGPVYWSAVSSGAAQIVKLANYGQEPQPMTIDIEGKAVATLSVLSNNDPNAANTDVASPIAAPSVFRIDASNGAFNFEMPPWSVAVLKAE